jgi:hypothetical protein
MITYNYIINSLGSITAIVILDYLMIPYIDKSELLILNCTSVAGIAIISVTFFYYINKIKVESTQVAPSSLI